MFAPLFGLLALAGCAADDCRPVAIGTLAIGERAGADVTAKCTPAGAAECAYRDAQGVEYVLRNGIVVQKEVAAERVLTKSLRAGAIDRATADDAAARLCVAFALKRDDAGRAYAESPERTDRGPAYPYRTLLYPADQDGAARVVVTTLPEN